MKKLKVMATSSQDEPIWDMISEKELAANNSIYIDINSEINLKKWKTEFLNLYNNWLNNDDQSIFDIKHPINTDIIEGLIKYNKRSTLYELYYWFDVNRDISPDFVWEISPISGDKLILLPNNYHQNNRLISSSEPLTFPL